MIKRIACLILILLPTNLIVGQQVPGVKFNHMSLTLETRDLKALRESSFVNDTLGVFETRTTYMDSSSTTTTSFLYGQSNYLELFETSQDDPILGFLTIVLSVDKINGIHELKKELDNSYQTGIRTIEKNYDGLMIPWYDSMIALDTSIVDSAYMVQAHFWFWIMGYKTEYFDYHGYTIENDELTRENYLDKFSETRADRIIKNFTGIGIKLNKDERNFLTRFFEYIGFKKLNENEYLSSENFRFLISERKPGDQYTLQFIEFETSKKINGKKDIIISDHISVSIQGNNGYLLIH